MSQIVTREELIEGSLILFVREALISRGYPQRDWRLVESFPYRMERLDVNTIAAGFTFDDGGQQAELGTNLKERQHTAEFFVFGLTNTWGRNLANAIKDALEADPNGMIPLRDVTDQPAMPIVDYLYLDTVHRQRQPVPDPEPWQENVWIVTVKVTDFYYPTLVGEVVIAQGIPTAEASGTPTVA